MARRTAEAYRRIQARKERIRNEQWGGASWKKWRICAVCENAYCANNYQDHRTRIQRFRGVEICAYCRFHCIKHLPRLQELGVIKLKKAK